MLRVGKSGSHILARGFRVRCALNGRSVDATLYAWLPHYPWLLSPRAPRRHYIYGATQAQFRRLRNLILFGDSHSGCHANFETTESQLATYVASPFS